ncbi:hypothetical protein LMG31884_46070 (plasmid) [Xanthomonas hydrangeae]|nr:hypothetical protein LMG31884_46070 [Xanthomonas hydrangeae]CAD7739964.1 hypothetical protein LMG31884_46070 [Xanthomonas hydrangeae]
MSAQPQRSASLAIAQRQGRARRAACRRVGAGSCSSWSTAQPGACGTGAAGLQAGDRTTTWPPGQVDARADIEHVDAGRRRPIRRAVGQVDAAARRGHRPGCDRTRPRLVHGQRGGIAALPPGPEDTTWIAGPVGSGGQAVGEGAQQRKASGARSVGVAGAKSKGAQARRGETRRGSMRSTSRRRSAAAGTGPKAAPKSRCWRSYDTQRHPLPQ